MLESILHCTDDGGGLATCGSEPAGPNGGFCDEGRRVTVELVFLPTGDVDVPLVIPAT